MYNPGSQGPRPPFSYSKDVRKDGPGFPAAAVWIFVILLGALMNSCADKFA